MKSGQQRQRWDAGKFHAVQRAQRASGLSVQAYCRREGLNLSSFYRWRRRVALSHRVAQRRAMVKQDLPRDEFIPLAALPMSSGLTLKFDLGGGIHLTVTR